jgi:hypothetical protein
VLLLAVYVLFAFGVPLRVTRPSDSHAEIAEPQRELFFKGVETRESE